MPKVDGYKILNVHSLVLGREPLANFDLLCHKLNTAAVLFISVLQIVFCLVSYRLLKRMRIQFSYYVKREDTFVWSSLSEKHSSFVCYFNSGDAFVFFTKMSAASSQSVGWWPAVFEYH